MRKKHITIGAVIAAIIAAVFFMSGCTSSGPSRAQHQETQQQAAISQTLVQNQPLPEFNYSQLRANLIQVETAQAEGVQTTSFFFNMGAADPIQSCPSIGAPIPTTDQLSNPQQVEHHSGTNNGGNVVIGQMDPNGAYTGDSSGTFVMCIGANGQPYADYWEGFVQTVFAPAVWDYKTHKVQVTGPASFKFTSHK